MNSEHNPAPDESNTLVGQIVETLRSPNPNTARSVRFIAADRIEADQREKERLRDQLARMDDRRAVAERRIAELEGVYNDTLIAFKKANERAEKAEAALRNK